MTQTIEILISPSGETRLETKGFEGSNCRAASRFIEAALGNVVAEERTAEFYHEANTLRDANRLVHG